MIKNKEKLLNLKINLQIYIRQLEDLKKKNPFYYYNEDIDNDKKYIEKILELLQWILGEENKIIDKIAITNHGILDIEIKNAIESFISL